MQIVYGEFDASGTATITLPIPFIDTTYQIVFGMRSTNSATMTARALSVISKSTTTFQKGYTNASFPYSYIAIGKWK